MVDEVVTNVTGQPTVAAAWASLVKPSDIVGIKVCANGAPLFSTHPQVVETIGRWPSSSWCSARKYCHLGSRCKAFEARRFHFAKAVTG